MSEERLARIETKVDQLAEAMVTMARMEERMITLFKKMDRYDEQQSSVEDRILALERSSIKRSAIEVLVDKAFWLIVGVGLTWLLKK